VARTRAITILFVDLVASTARRARMGDDHFDQFTARFLAALRSAISEHNGHEVSSAGDGLMVVFLDSVADAVTCAVDMHAAVAPLDEDDPPHLRVGISTGEVAEDDGDYQGMPIVEAARLEAAAEPGQTLTTAVVRSLIGTRRGLRFRDVGLLSLKGLPAPLPAVAVVDEDVVLPEPRRRRRISKRRRPVVVGVVAVVAIVVAGVAFAVSRRNGGTSSSATAGITAPKNYTPRFEPGACPDDVTSVVTDATCGHLVVPQDRSKPNGRLIHLAVTRSPARVAAPAPDPTIDLCGCENPANSVARDHGELIHLNSRGFQGTDPPLTCPEVAAARRDGLAKPASDQATDAATIDAITRCHDRLIALGIDPAKYNFDEASLDTIDLMVALGIHRADLLGNGDTDMIAFGVLRRAPAAVRSLTLENPPPPGATDWSHPTDDLAAAFSRYEDLCKADPVCANGYPDLAGTLKTVSATLQANPQLVQATTPDDNNPTPLPVLIDNARAADALRGALGDPTTYTVIPSVLVESTADALTGDTLLQHDPYLWDDQAPWGALLSYVCSYHIHTADENGAALAARTHPEFVGDTYAHWPQWCDAWKVPDISSVISVDVASPVPVLAFRGDLSPSGSSDWMRVVLRGFANGHSAIFPTLGDDLLTTGPPCLSDLRRKFLTDPAAPLDTNQCVSQSPVIHFTAPG
jgi:class 3 adenylate cyclase/pimeloyl-ACP methyl ester carboxylesterase